MVPLSATPLRAGAHVLVAALLAVALLGGLALRHALTPPPLTLDFFETGPTAEESRRNGKKRAQHDIAAGHPRYLTVGIPGTASYEFELEMRELYGVETELGAGCLVDEAILGYVAEYNHEIRRWLREAHGFDVIERAWQIAAVRYAESVRIFARDRAEALNMDEDGLAEVLEEIDLRALLSGPDEAHPID